MSSSPFSSASGQRSSGTVRVISLRSQAWSASVSDFTACSKWRRFAFTDPNTTSFSSTSSLLSAPTSTLSVRDGATPVRQTMAPGAVCRMAPATSSATPVHSTTMSGWTSSATSVTSPAW